MAEIDLDPNSKAKVVVCSLHFRDGFPTEEFPYPTELLGESSPVDGPVFKGKRPVEGGSYLLGDWVHLEAK